MKVMCEISCHSFNIETIHFIRCNLPLKNAIGCVHRPRIFRIYGNSPSDQNKYSWKEGELVENDNKKISADDHDYNNGSDDSSESDSSSAQVGETASGISGGGSAKTGSKKGGKMTGFSDDSSESDRRDDSRD